MLVLGMLAAMDEAVGKVVNALKRSGDFDNTLIVFTTDNGGSVSHAASNLPLRGTKVGWMILKILSSYKDLEFLIENCHRAPSGKEELVAPLLSIPHFFQRLREAPPMRVSYKA